MTVESQHNLRKGGDTFIGVLLFDFNRILESFHIWKEVNLVFEHSYKHYLHYDNLDYLHSLAMYALYMFIDLTFFQKGEDIQIYHITQLDIWLLLFCIHLITFNFSNAQSSNETPNNLQSKSALNTMSIYNSSFQSPFCLNIS